MSFLKFDHYDLYRFHKGRDFLLVEFWSLYKFLCPHFSLLLKKQQQSFLLLCSLSKFVFTLICMNNIASNGYTHLI